tara:strand:+ start:603 stop:737 length:135 start_codon:yes stop_codon:yes gene_type:complete
MLEFIFGPLQELRSFAVWGDIMMPPFLNWGPLGSKAFESDPLGI